MDNETKGRKSRPFSPNVNVWLDVKADIEIKIIMGEFVAGDRVPPIVKIAELYDVGNSTAKKVLGSLCDDGTIVKQKGVGYFVKPHVKERLLKVHERELNNRFSEVIRYGKRIGLDDENIFRIVREAVTETNNE